MAILRFFTSLHDKVSRASFMLAACLLAFISAAYCFEVVSRYFFNKPTVWASPLVSYGLCLTIFLALPDLTRRGLHVSVDLHTEWIKPETSAKMMRFTHFVSGVSCFFGAFITGEQAWSEFTLGVFTNTYLPIPKWWLFVFIPYGLLSGGFYFLRQSLGEAVHKTEEPIQ